MRALCIESSPELVKCGDDTIKLWISRRRNFPRRTSRIFRQIPFDPGKVFTPVIKTEGQPEARDYYKSKQEAQPAVYFVIGLTCGNRRTRHCPSRQMPF